MGQQDAPGSVRIRTGEGNEWRYDAIERAADYHDCNRTDAVAYACEDVVQLVSAAREVLQREDLTEKQRREMADTLSVHAVSFDVEQSVAVERDPSTPRSTSSGVLKDEGGYSAQTCQGKQGDYRCERERVRGRKPDPARSEELFERDAPREEQEHLKPDIEND